MVVGAGADGDAALAGADVDVLAPLLVAPDDVAGAAGAVTAGGGMAASGAETAGAGAGAGISDRGAEDEV